MTKRLITALLFSLILALQAGASLGDGMRFRSYDAPAEQRTSLKLPAGASEWLTFSDSLTVSFSLKIERERGAFGYICRIGVDDLLPIDVILSPHDDALTISATADHHNMISLYDEGEDVGEWKDLYIRFSEEGENLVVTANSREVFRAAMKARRHRIKFYFGKVDAPGYATSDVAPMVMADLQVRIDSRKTLAWMLQDGKDLSMRHGVSIKACNPVFLLENNKHWTRLLSLGQPSVSYSCFSPDRGAAWIISGGQVTKVDVRSGEYTVRPYSTDMKINFARDQFETLPDGTLVYADVERGQFIRYDGSEWEAPNGRSRTFTRLHNSTVYLPGRGRFLEMFGYGQHRYSNLAWEWSAEDFSRVSSALEGVEPRYLAGAGTYGGKVYVLGGKGNESGLQELGVRFYDSLVEIDPDGLSARTLWSSGVLSGNAVAKDLVIVEDRIYALLFNPEVHDSSLQLWGFDLADGSAAPLADTIPYPFLDISAQARLGFDEATENLVATVCFTGDDGKPCAEVWTLGFPPLPATAVRARKPVPSWVWTLIIAVLTICIILTGVALIRRKPSPDEFDILPQQSVPKGPGVYLIGGFRVIDREGTDIASSFSPNLMQLLAILVLYTADRGGVSNARLKSILWADKSDESFNNNKGVSIARLREKVSQAGDITIVQDGGSWKIDGGAEMCDYIVARQRLEGDDAALILRTASWGALLPEYHYDWLDPFKARYTDLVLSRLDALTGAGVSPELAVKIADCRLLFDSIDEDAVFQKCQALVSLGRVGTSKGVFERFTVEYRSIMGEEFPKDFTSFLKKNPH